MTRKQDVSGARVMELLLPAGSPEALYAAIEGGADAVYLGLDHFSARGRAKNFSDTNFPGACRLAREKGVKLYLTLNTLIKNDELPLLIERLAFAAAGVDAIITQDWGVFFIIKKYFPDIPVHASTQMAVHNSLGARMAGRLGFARVVLARELTLPEIAAAAREKAAEIEVFVHGALCYSVSGHCLMSSFIGGMSANRGFCRQPCRRRYTLCDEDTSDQCPDFPLFNLRDLELIDYLGALQKVGVHSLKIEGRMKPAEYVYNTAKAYRLALDNPRNIREAKAILREDLAREKTAYFVGGTGEAQNVLARQSYTGRVIGRVEKITPNGFTLTLQSRISARDRLRIQPASGEDSISFRVAEIRALRQSVEFAEEAQQAEIIPRFTEVSEAAEMDTEPNADRDGFAFHVPRDSNGSHAPAAWMKNLRVGDIVLKVGTRELRFPSRLPGAHSSAEESMPQRRILDEILRQTAPDVSGESELIMRIDTLAWLAKVQPEKLDALILDFTLGDWAQVQFARPSIERNRDRLVLQLPLFIPENSIAPWRKIIERFYAAGCTSFMVSQVWQLPLLEGLPGAIGIWAAETVYCLNDAAAVFLDSLGFERRVLPLENDAPNLQNARDRNGIVPLYYRPRLFVSRVPVMDAGDICRERDGEYMAEIRDDMLMLTPALPVSWFQYRRALEDAGYSRFMIDLSAEKPSQHTFMRMLRLFDQGEAVQPSCAFNYKDGLS